MSKDTTRSNLSPNVASGTGDGAEGQGQLSSTSKRAAPETISLIIGDAHRHVELPLAHGVLLGRTDQTDGVFPDLDLTPYGGLEMGVSRRHAQLACTSTEVVIEDLGSVNGTFWNGQRLSPRQAQALQDGDEVRLGRLTMQVRMPPSPGF